MSRSERRCPLIKTVLGLVLTLALCGLLLLETACQDLSSDTSTTVSTTTTTEMDPDSSTVTVAGDTSGDASSGGAERGAEPEDGGDADSGDDDDSITPTGPIATAHFFTTTTEDRSIGDWWEFDDGDDYRRVTIHRRDAIRVELEYPRLAHVTHTHWDLGGPSGMIGNIGFDDTRSILGDYIIGVTYEFIATETGECTLMILSYHERDGDYHVWQLNVEVTE